MKKVIFIGCFTLLLCSCTTNESSWLVRFWNGDYSRPKLSEAEKYIWKECNKETGYYPPRADGTRDDFTKCEIRKKKELGIK